MIVAADSTPLIILMKAMQIDILHKLFGEVAVPEAVYILPSVAKCPKDILQAAKQPKAALRLCRGQYDVALAALCAAPPSLTADFKMSFRHFEIARSIMNLRQTAAFRMKLNRSGKVNLSELYL